MVWNLATREYTKCFRIPPENVPSHTNRYGSFKKYKTTKSDKEFPWQKMKKGTHCP
jgi:hypothetical protein